MHTFAHEFAIGLWHLPWDAQSRRRGMEVLVEELKAYPVGAHDDTVKSAFYARETFFRTAPKKPWRGSVGVIWF